LGETLASAYFLLSKTRRRVLRQNLSIVLGTPGDRAGAAGDSPQLDSIGRRVMLNFGRGVVETFMLPHLGPQDMSRMVDIEGKEKLDSALSSGRGVVFATAHLGSWELAGAALASLGYHITTVAGVQFSPALSPMVRQMKERLGITVVSMNTGALTIARTLHRGGVVALHIDGDQFTDGVGVKYFGRDITLPRGPAALALKSGAALLPAFAVRTSRRHITIMIEDDVSEAARDEIDATQRIAGVVEKYVKLYPDQWCMFRSFWEDDL
jgi:KDO2-lipid IV(A) lauroyltransferase